MCYHDAMPKSFLRETAGVFMRAGVVLVTIFMLILLLPAIIDTELAVGDGDCNVAVLPIDGAILPFYGLGDFSLAITPDTVNRFMNSVEEQGHIDGVLLEINSPGGTPVAAERIAQRFQASSLPVIGLVGDMAVSGGYLVAAASDYLIASAMSDVASIGVNMSYLEESQKLEEEGVTYVQLTTGEYKDVGSPNRPITEEERALLQADLELIHDEFVRQVAEYRNLSVAEVDGVADGLPIPGLRALDLNLIDQIGGRTEARSIFANILEMDVADISFCEYERGLFSFY